MATKDKKDWTEYDEEEDVMEAHFETVKVMKPTERKMEDGTVQIVDQPYLVRKWKFPIRKQVKERKNMTKFGEVKGVPKGQHKQGDYQLENTIKIETSKDNAELNIVNQLAEITTETMRMNKEKQKLAEIEKEAIRSLKKEEEAKTATGGDKWAKMFGSDASKGYSLKVSSIYMTETNLEDIQNGLEEFFNELFGEADIRFHRLRLIKTRDRPPRFLNKCYLSFNEESHAKKAYQILENSSLNDTILEVEWAQDRPAKPRN